MRRSALAGGVVCLGLLAGTVSPAGADVDSEHLFGFTEGTDIGSRDDRELEWGSHAGFGKRTGTYRAIDTALEGKFTVDDDLRVSPGIDFAHRRIVGQQALGTADRTETGLQGLHVELKYRVLDRHVAPFGLTLGLTPRWSRLDEASGARGDAWSLDFLVSLDKELVPDRWFGAFNLRHGAGRSRLQGAADWQDGSDLAASAALAARVGASSFLGAEVRYLRAHGSLAWGDRTGQALFAGPVLNIHLTDALWLAAGWNIQVAGRGEGDARHLDLVNFERHQVTVKLGHAF